MEPESVQIFEVGPRDGLQNETRILTLKDKIWFIQELIHAGIRNLEIGAFVRPDRVPQMADTDRLYEKVNDQIRARKLKLNKAELWCLVPNSYGLQRAIKVGAANRIAVFTAVSETFNKKNIGMSVRQSLSEIRSLLQEARSTVGAGLQIRGYISTAFGCPFEGKVSPTRTLRVIDQLAALGVDQISIGDTIGVATPADVVAVIRPAIKSLGISKTAVHFHDTRGTALANTLRAMDLGVRIIDSSAGGFGGCPFAPGASGNLATEDLVYMLNGMGVKTGVNLEKLCKTSLKISKALKKPVSSRYLQAVTCRL